MQTDGRLWNVNSSITRVRARKNIASILPTHPTQHQHPNVSGFRRPHPFYCGNEKIDYVLL